MSRAVSRSSTGRPGASVSSSSVRPDRSLAPHVARLHAVLDDLVERGVTPGGVAAIAFADGVAWEHAFGLRALVPEPEPASLDTLYDLASLTKPLVTAELWLQARHESLSALDRPISELVPEMEERPGGERVPTVAELLLHAGGIPPWLPLYALVDGGLPERAAYLGRHRGAPGRRAVYGCPGYQLLGLALERLHGRPLAAIAQERVLAGLDAMFLDTGGDDVVGRTAPTEEGNACERALSRDEALAGFGDPGGPAQAYGGFRSGIIRGQVHDHNAFTIGGAAGNAGLFATVRATAALCARLLADPRGEIAELSQDLAPHLDEGGELRSWGWQLARSRNSPAGDAIDSRGFGHAGFTGTSVLVDPTRGAAYVLLTNRIHPRFVDLPFHAERKRFHEAASAAVEDLRG